MILVAEDNAISRTVIVSLLENQGFRCEVVGNGQEAVNAVMQGMQPVLVLMDCEMPVTNGYQATEKIRQWERETGKTHLPIIALTANAFEDNRQRCFAAGMDDFLSKPVNMNLWWRRSISGLLRKPAKCSVRIALYLNPLLTPEEK